MKVIRSKTPLTFGDLSKKSGIVATVINAWTWEEEFNRYRADVKDFEVIDAEDPAPGEPLKRYVLINSRTRYRSPAEVNGLFQYFGEDVIVGDDYNAKSRLLQVKGLLYDTQQNPIYGSQASDWEIIDTETEIAPEL